MISSLSPFYITEILKMWYRSKEIVGPNYGFNNMWIIKPAGVARGSGISITNNLSKISQLKYGKIVQKYIEHPLILNCKRKFDIRQWILIRSFSPLKVYAFKKCYGRFSCFKYSN
jgi:tubulin monoglycylase TTLL3/8